MSYSIKTFEAENAQDAYKQLTDALNEDGQLIETRGEITQELLNVSVEIKDPRHRIINIPNFNLPFILQETFDILNGNQPRVIHSKEMLEKTMGNSADPMFFGNEMRQAFSRRSLLRIKEVFAKDKNTRKAILDLGSRHPNKHTPCLIYAHFLIRDNKFYMTAETRGTAVSMGFTNDVFFLTLIQELIYDWLVDEYPDLELGSFLYKTVSLHAYVDVLNSNATPTIYKPTWDQTVRSYFYNEVPINLTHDQFVRDMGALHYYVDDYMKATSEEDVDAGSLTLYTELKEPDQGYFVSRFFYNWAVIAYHSMNHRLDNPNAMRKHEGIKDTDLMNIFNASNIRTNKILS